MSRLSLIHGRWIWRHFEKREDPGNELELQQLELELELELELAENYFWFIDVPLKPP